MRAAMTWQRWLYTAAWVAVSGYALLILWATPSFYDKMTEGYSDAAAAAADVGEGATVVFVLFVWVIATIILALLFVLAGGRQRAGVDG